MWHPWERTEMYAGVGGGGLNLKERDSLEHVGVDGRIVLLKWILNKWNWCGLW